MTDTRRRSILKAAAAAGAFAGAALARPAIAQGRLEWSMVTAWPKGFPVQAASAERLARRIGTLSDGKLTIRIFAGGELVPAPQCFDAVADGRADIAHDIGFNHFAKTRMAAFFAAIPFGLTDGELGAWIGFGGGQPLWDELYAPFNIKPLLAGMAGTQAFGWLRRDIRAVEDLRGLKLRLAGFAPDVLRRLGAVPTAVPGDELVAALRGGDLDGAEWYGPAQDLALGLYEAASLHLGPAVLRPSLALSLLVNKRRHDALPDDLRRAIAAAAAAEAAESAWEAQQRAAEAFEVLVSRHGIQPRRLPNEVLAALGNAAGQMLADERERADALGRRIFDSYLRVRKLAVPLARFGEQPFYEARALAYKFIE